MFTRTPPAHAKLMYREEVTIEDAVVAVSVMECSMQVRDVWTQNNNQGSNCDRIFDQVYAFHIGIELLQVKIGIHTHRLRGMDHMTVLPDAEASL